MTPLSQKQLKRKRHIGHLNKMLKMKEQEVIMLMRLLLKRDQCIKEKNARLVAALSNQGMIAKMAKLSANP